MGVHATTLLVWGIVVHLVVDWLLQNDWMARHKAKRRERTQMVKIIDSVDNVRGTYLGGGKMTVEGNIAESHKSTRQVPGPWWDRHPAAYIHAGMHGVAQLLVFPWWAALAIGVTHLLIDTRTPVVWWSRLIRQTQPKSDRYLDIGAEVRVWSDQVWHIAVVALAALVVA